MRGGRREGAGRKPGSKNHVLAAAKDRFREVLQQHEPAIVRRLLRSSDDRVLLEFLKLCVFYVDGRPREQLQVSHSVSIEGILEELARRRLGRTTETPKLLPPGDEETRS